MLWSLTQFCKYPETQVSNQWVTKVSGSYEYYTGFWKLLWNLWSQGSVLLLLCNVMLSHSYLLTHLMMAVTREDTELRLSSDSVWASYDPKAKLLLRTCRCLHQCHLLTSISLNKSCLVTCAWLCLLFFWWGKHKFYWAASVFNLSMLLKIIIDNWTIISPKLSLKRGIWIATG